MAFFAKFDADGLPTAFYGDDIWGDNIPSDAISISDEQWLEFINNAGRRRWADGEVVAYEPPPASVPVPASVSRAQAKIALSRAGLLSAVAQKVSEAGGEVAIWFEDALNWRRDNPNVAALGTSLGLTEEQIDGLFLSAAQIEA